MSRLFDYDNIFFRAINKIVDIIHLSLLWLLFSLPIITIGASSTALYYTVHRSLRQDRGYIWRSFWHAFKSDFKQTTRIWLILAGIFAFLFVDGSIMRGFLDQGLPIGLLCYFFYFMMLFWLIYCVYIFTYSARFENGIKETMKNTAFIALLNLPCSFIVLVIVCLGLVLVYSFPFVIIIVPTLATSIMNLFLEKIFRKYMNREDLQREQELGTL